MLHRCVIFRIHHLLGDRILLLLSMFLTSCEKLGWLEEEPVMMGFEKKKERGKGWSFRRV